MYRSFLKQLSNENIVSFIPPGFRHSINVQFPRGRLPVCQKCKKTSKTRDQCRTRACHKDIPWCDIYVCISLDNSCTGNDGKILDGPFVAKNIMPTNAKLKGDVDPRTPVCASCKERNYTRNYCRVRKKHQQLPWSAVHVIISLKKDANVGNSATSSLIVNRKQSARNSGGESAIFDSNQNSFYQKKRKSVTIDDGTRAKDDVKNNEDSDEDHSRPR